MRNSYAPNPMQITYGTYFVHHKYLNLMSFCSAAWNSVLGLELQLAGQPPSAGYSVGQTRYGHAPSFWQISRQ